MRTVLPIASAVLSVALPGCGAIQRMQASKDQDAVNAICAVQIQDRRLLPLHPVMPVNADGASVAQLASKEKFTPEQKEALGSFSAALAHCYAAKIRWAQAYEAPVVANLYQNFYQQERLLMAQAIRDDLPIGKLNEARASLFARTSGDIALANQQFAQQQAEEAAQNAAAWAAVSNSLQQAQQTQLMQQQLFQQQMMMNRPVQTNCTRWGSQVNCTSY